MEKQKTKVLFMGTSELAREILEAIVFDGYPVVGVFTQPDKKAGRNREPKPSPVKESAAAHKLTVYEPDLLDAEATSIISSLNPDIIVIVAYGKILPKEIITLPKFKSINVHPSLLPKFRGPSPIQNAILEGEKETGVTIMLVDEKVDHGDILAQKKVPIAPDDTTATFMKKIAPISAELLLEIIPRFISGEIKPQKQNDVEATYCQLVEREDGHIFWDGEAQKIYDRWRAFQPWPGVFTIWENGSTFMRIKITKLSVYAGDLEKQHGIGEVFDLGSSVGVQTSSGVIVLEEIQPEGKNPMSVRDFINGYPAFLGSTIK